jgi:hypothetical protein
MISTLKGPSLTLGVMESALKVEESNIRWRASFNEASMYGSLIFDGKLLDWSDRFKGHALKKHATMLG